MAVISLVAAACGDSDDSGSSSGGETTATEAESSGDEGESSESASDEAVAGGTLVIGTTQVARTLNGAVQSGLATAVPGTQINASPLLYDENYNPQPYLAESWEVADDGLSVTLHLVDGAVFHDGMPITSADVAFSIETVQEFHPFKPMFAPVTSVDTPDPLTAVINLSQPHPAILLAMSPALLPIIPKHIFDDGQDMPTHPRNTEDVVGSGPFKVVDFDPANVIRLERFDDFFIEGTPYLDGIIIQTVADANTLVLGIENGEIDMAALTNSRDITRLMDQTGRTVTSEGHQGLGAINWLEFNLSNEFLAIKEVRQAIALAIDREFIREALLGGVFPDAPAPIAPSSPFFHSGIEPYDLDLEAAAALLEQAGFPGGEGISLEIDFIPPAGGELQGNQAEYIVQALEEIGIDVTVRASPDFPTWAERIASGDFDMTMNNVWNWGDPVIGVHRSYLSDNRVGVIWTNNTGYENAEVDSLLAEAGKATDEAARRDFYVQFQDIVAEELPIYWLTNSTFWQTYPDTLVNPPLTIWGQMSPMHLVQLPN